MVSHPDRLLAALARVMTQARTYAPESARFREIISEPVRLLKAAGHTEITWHRHNDPNDEVEALLLDFSDKTGIQALAIRTHIAEDELARFLSLLVEDHVDVLAMKEAQQSRHGKRHGDLDMTRKVLEAKLARSTIDRLTERNVRNAVALRARDLLEPSEWVPLEVRVALTRAVVHPDEEPTGRRAILAPLVDDAQRAQFFRFLSEVGGTEVKPLYVTALDDVAQVRALVRSGAVSPEDVPVELRGRMEREASVAELLADPLPTLSALAQGHAHALPGALAAVPELLRRGRTEDVAKIHDALAALGPPDVTALGLVDWLAEGLVNANGAAAQPMLDIVVALGVEARPVLRAVLDSTESERLCGSVAAALENVAEPDWVYAELQGPVEGMAARYLLRILGDLGHVGHARALKPFLRAASSRTRAAALEAAYKLGAEKAVPVLLAALKDKNAGVARRSPRQPNSFA